MVVYVLRSRIICISTLRCQTILWFMHYDVQYTPEATSLLLVIDCSVEKEHTPQVD